MGGAWHAGSKIENNTELTGAIPTQLGLCTALTEM
jgi:hypothetical protein